MCLKQATLPFCLNVKPKCLCSGKHPDPVHLWMAARKKKSTHPLPEAGYSRRYLQNLWPFYSTSPPLPPLCSIKETGTQTLIRWVFGDISPPSSRSAGFPNSKSESLPQRLVSGFIGLSCGKQRELGLGSSRGKGEGIDMRCIMGVKRADCNARLDTEVAVWMMPQIRDSDLWVDHDAFNEKLGGKPALGSDEVPLCHFELKWRR